MSDVEGTSESYVCRSVVSNQISGVCAVVINPRARLPFEECVGSTVAKGGSPALISDVENSGGTCMGWRENKIICDFVFFGIRSPLINLIGR